jgi:SAM-dependent methyltransferase
MEIDAANPDHFRDLENQFDTVIMLNVLEHLEDEQQALRNLWSALQPGGRAIVLVPQHPALYGTLDKALEHRKRYTPADFEQALTQAGFRVEKIFDFNRFSAPGWWLNGKVLRRKKFSRTQLKIMDTLMPVLKRIEGLWPWSGVSVIGIGVKD